MTPPEWKFNGFDVYKILKNFTNKASKTNIIHNLHSCSLPIAVLFMTPTKLQQQTNSDLWTHLVMLILNFTSNINDLFLLPKAIALLNFHLQKNTQTCYNHP